MQRIDPDGACLVYTDVVITHVFLFCLCHLFPLILGSLGPVMISCKMVNRNKKLLGSSSSIACERSLARVCPAQLGGSPSTSCPAQAGGLGMTVGSAVMLRRPIARRKKQFKVIRITYNCRKQISSATVLYN